MLNLNLSMTVQIGSLGFQLIVQDDEWEPHPTMLRFLSVEEKKILIFRLCHMKATACQEESTPEAKHAVILFSRVCMCMCMLVFPHLQVACGIQKVRSGFPAHFPFYLLKQGLLLNPKLVESSNLTTKSPEESHLPPKHWDNRQPPWPPGTQSLRKQTLVLMFAGQELCPLNHFTSSCEKINCVRK